MRFVSHAYLCCDIRSIAWIMIFIWDSFIVVFLRCCSEHCAEFCLEHLVTESFGQAAHLNSIDRIYTQNFFKYFVNIKARAMRATTSSVLPALLSSSSSLSLPVLPPQSSNNSKKELELSGGKNRRGNKVHVFAISMTTANELCK